MSKIYKLVKMSVQYLTYYKAQSLAVLICMVFSIALLSGVSSLVYNADKSNLQNQKEISGDWNYAITVTPNLLEKITRPNTPGYSVDNYSICKILMPESEESDVTLLYGDEQYLEMTAQQIIAGAYPKNENEVALNQFTYDNFDEVAEIGDPVEINGKQYTLTGITRNEWANNAYYLLAYVCEPKAEQVSSDMVYLKFSEARKLYKQMDAMLKDLGIEEEHLLLRDVNFGLNYYFGREGPGALIRSFKLIFSGKGGLAYFFQSLRDGVRLNVNGSVLALELFNLFMIYSIFNIAAMKRVSYYGILDVLGIGRKNKFFLILSELWILLLIAYPLGVFLGNFGVGSLYNKFNTVFLNKNLVDSGYYAQLSDYLVDTQKIKAQGFHVSWQAVIIEAAFLFGSMLVIAWLVLKRTEQLTILQMLKMEDPKKIKRNRKIYAVQNGAMTNVLTRKFAFEVKGTFFSVLLSLSLGGVIFLCSNFVMGNVKVDHQMRLEADNGLGFEYKIYFNSDNLNQTIEEKYVTELKKIRGVETAYTAKSYIGELIVGTDEFFWADFWYDKDYFLRKVDRSRYGIKTNIMGYDDGLLNKLNLYSLEGRIDVENMKNTNSVVLVTLEDGVGNHDGLAKQAGDKITLRVPKKLSGTVTDLILAGATADYEEKEFTIAAVVRRTLLKDNRLYFQKDQGLHMGALDQTFSVIMSNAQMQKNFGIEGYSAVGLKTREHADTENITFQLQKITAAIKNCLFQDFVDNIKQQNEFYLQSKIFLYGISIVFFVISLCYILNSMNYLVLSRKHEYGILRAMGITNGNFFKMMIQQGIFYGILSSVVMLFFYFLAQKVAVYFMIHVYGFLESDVPVNPLLFFVFVGLNIFIGILAVLLPTYLIIKEDIIKQVNLQ